MALVRHISLKVSQSRFLTIQYKSNTGKWEEADGAIKEAAEKDPNFADTLINQVVVSFDPGRLKLICSLQVATQTGHQDVARRTLASLRGSCAQHPFVRDLESKEAEIDRLIKQYQPVN